MSSTTPNMGKNISTAVDVLRETYKNLHLLFSELDRIGEDEGFVPITPKFLRWKSDSAHEGWLTSNFIKLYQIENEHPLTNITDLKNGPIFGIEVDLGENEYPVIALIRYHFDYSYWTRLPNVSDHWVFWGPFRYDHLFKIEETEDTWTSKSVEKTKLRYWGFEHAVAHYIPLLSITSSEDIKNKLFQQLKNIPESF
ncbi:hypothetical protein BKP37_08915 [Anaerobacillus alkalilacustris]|uniref:Uncharacterized protein n=1 Tax=Anaerobacillus alkalilacustris TaxID=393763 RepID=A0A1S2LPI6_9BACI|nr:hypothetical protein [Anaerobacillus alkalilacustris]OIJ14286.1 hypothetical protein BKP37_08915 [Anaerobacillus alkalilacustris]